MGPPATRRRSMARLPAGRRPTGGLSSGQVTANQRERMLLAMADAVAAAGYAEVTVADVVDRAGVSRSTFYQQFPDRKACFLAAFDLAASRLVSSLAQHLPDRVDPPSIDGLIGRYLDAVLADPNLARVFLVDIYAAGPEAFARRSASQDRMAAALAAMTGARTEAARFACSAFVAATSALVSARLAAGDLDGVRALRQPLSRLAADLVQAHRPPR